MAIKPANKKRLETPSSLPAAKRKAAVEGVSPSKARAIAAKEPAFKAKRDKTIKPLAPERVNAILHALQKTYPNVVCALIHHNAFELTIATILSAQTTLG
jgi:endonuclease-3